MVHQRNQARFQSCSRAAAEEQQGRRGTRLKKINPLLSPFLLEVSEAALSLRK
jgi:hypothetical protein